MAVRRKLPSILVTLLSLLALVLAVVLVARKGCRDDTGTEDADSARRVRVKVSLVDRDATPVSPPVEIRVVSSESENTVIARSETNPAIINIPAGNYDFFGRKKSASDAPEGVWKRGVMVKGEEDTIFLRLEPGTLKVVPLLAENQPFEGVSTVTVHKPGDKKFSSPIKKGKGGEALTLPPGNYGVKVLCRTPSGWLGATESKVEIGGGESTTLPLDLNAGALLVTARIGENISIPPETARTLKVFAATDEKLSESLGGGKLTADPIYMPAGNYNLVINYHLPGMTVPATLKDVHIAAGETGKAQVELAAGVLELDVDLAEGLPLLDKQPCTISAYDLQDSQLRRPVGKATNSEKMIYLAPGDYIIRVTTPTPGRPLEAILPQVTIVAGEIYTARVSFKAGLLELKTFFADGKMYKGEKKRTIEVYSPEDKDFKNPLFSTNTSSGKIYLHGGDYAVRVVVEDGDKKLTGVLSRVTIMPGQKSLKGVVVRSEK